MKISKKFPNKNLVYALLLIIILIGIGYTVYKMCQGCRCNDQVGEVYNSIQEEVLTPIPTEPQDVSGDGNSKS